MAVQFVVGLQAFQRAVHAVAPVIARDGGHVDALIGRVAVVADLSVRSQPVLQGQYGKHGANACAER